MPWTIRLLRGIEIGVYTIFFAALLSSSSLRISSDPVEVVRRYTRPVEFDFFTWTADALGIKFAQAALDTPFYFNATTRHKIVVDYLHLMDQILRDEYKLNLIYTDPSVTNPASASADLRNELAGLYAHQRQLAPIAESVLQEQVADILADLKLTTGGQPLPPVLFHISPLPYNLVVSPRDKIQQEAAVSLIPDLTVDQQDALENKVAAGLDVSALVVPVGGLGSYPTMVMRTTAFDWVTDTVAHEWIHNWLTLRPLGLNYTATPELRTMNETTASIAGHEISVILLRRYYPELSAEYTQPTVSTLGNGLRLDFDYRAEMHTTRLHVDELLTQGKIDEAEAYMEQRRLFFWDNGYAIRKLNQAYFAFYGAYADVPGGEAGTDPVGPAVRALRAQSANLTQFLKKIARMSSFKELQAAVSP